MTILDTRAVCGGFPENVMRQIGAAALVAFSLGYFVCSVVPHRNRPGPRADEHPSRIVEIEVSRPVPGQVVMRRDVYRVVSAQIGAEFHDRAVASRNAGRVTLRGYGEPVMLLVEPVPE